MHLGIVGPVSTRQLKPLLAGVGDSLPVGLGGIPVNNLILELWSHVDRMTVFTLSEDVDPERAPVVVSNDKLSIHYGPFRSRARHRMLDFFRVERRFLLDAIQSVRPDLLHAHWQYEWGWAALDSGIPTLLTCHDAPLQVLAAQRDLYRLGRLLMAAYVLRRARHMTAVSDYTARALRLFTSCEIKVIPNFEPRYVFDLYKQKRWRPGARIAMANNGFGPLKNVRTAIQAFQLVRNAYPETTLHLFGDDFGPGEQAQSWATARNLTENVIFHGYKDSYPLMDALVAMDVFLHTSLQEACSLALLEASALGLPIVGGKASGGVPWTLDHGRAGLLVDVTSPHAVADALKRIISDENLYERLSRASRQNALTRFSPEVVVAQYLQEYRQLLSQIGSGWA